jgi:predicted  nucleic acid-binding Zn-ribbon protein
MLKEDLELYKSQLKSYREDLSRINKTPAEEIKKTQIDFLKFQIKRLSKNISKIRERIKGCDLNDC